MSYPVEEPTRAGRSGVPQAQQERLVAVILHDGFQATEVAGPIDVFDTANRWLTANGRPTAYECITVSVKGVPVRAAGGMTLIADHTLADMPPAHTVIVVGGPGAATLDRPDPALLEWLRHASDDTPRITSVCTGAFILAEAGLLDGRRAATHWLATRHLAERFPQVRVEENVLFVEDGPIWTSAGVTASIDMALALVERDLGRDAALGVARVMVVPLKRPGGQPQMSVQLSAQLDAKSPIARLSDWILANLDQDLSSSALARRAAMSERNFTRVFRRETGLSAHLFVMRARLEAARMMLSDSDFSMKEVARRSGFFSEETMRRSMLREVGRTPSNFRERFNGGSGRMAAGNAALLS